MSSDTMIVVLEDRPIGELNRLRDGRLRLRFDESYRTLPAPTPLSVSMSPDDATQEHERISPWLWGLLPDNADVLNRWGRQFQVSAASPFTLLSTPIGYDCAGAVQFCAPADLDSLLSRPSEIEWLTESDLAERLRLLRSQPTSWLGPGSTGQFSLGGAQAKFALHNHDGRWGEPSGALPTTHILKPAIPGFDDQHVNEHLCMSAAAALGLETAETRIETFEDQTVLAVKRFDRRATADGLARVHQEDLCQALSVPPTQKYQAAGGPSPDQIAEVLRAHVSGASAEREVWRFASALAFNWLIAGTDAHAKNYALLLDHSDVELAPLYDVSSYLPYDDTAGHKVKLAMALGGDYRLRDTDRQVAWQRTARQLGLDADHLVAVVATMAELTPQAFESAAQETKVKELNSALPERLVELVTARCQSCVSALQ